MGMIVGIDLGTTFSAVARLDETGRPVIIHNSEGHNITPSVVTFEGPTTSIVGEEARKQLGGPNTIGRFKRDMGTGTIYKSEYGVHTPPQLSTLVLAKLKAEAEKATGQSITEAVVTIPANFSNEARQATFSAAKVAGLEVKHIINEPTAAAMYFAHSSGRTLGGIYAVYDLGGGTFDVTIMRVDGKTIEVLATEGVSRLGGDDFDEKIRELVIKKYAAKTGGTLSKDDFLINDAEDMKKTLSQRPKATTRAQGSAGRADIEVTRAEFEEAISTLIAQTEMLCESALDEAKIKPSDMAEVILAGGSTRMPVVVASVQRVFGKPPVTFGNPDEVVALGAAIYAAFKTDASNLNTLQRQGVANVKVADITSKYFGTISLSMNEQRGQTEARNVIVIPKGARLPASKTETFFTVNENQTGVDCQVTEANSPETDPRFVRIIWEGQLGPLPGGRPAGQPIEITYTYDANQMMKCAFVDKSTGKRVEIDISMTKADDGDGFDIEKFTVE